MHLLGKQWFADVLRSANVRTMRKQTFKMNVLVICPFLVEKISARVSFNLYTHVPESLRVCC